MTTGIKQTKEPDIFDPYIEGNFGTLLQILHTSIYCIVVVHYEEGEKKFRSSPRPHQRILRFRTFWELISYFH